MADKMKEQQIKQQEEARKEMARKHAAAAKEKESLSAEKPEKRATRATEKQGVAGENGEIRMRNSDGPRQENTPKKLPTRERPKKKAKGNTISSYFKKADVDLTEDNPTVQEALERAADEFEAKPSALGEQNLVATQQPALV